jgi:hypothetical protein
LNTKAKTERYRKYIRRVEGKRKHGGRARDKKMTYHSWLWRHVVSQKYIDVSEVHTASITRALMMEAVQMVGGICACDSQ